MTRIRRIRRHGFVRDRSDNILSEFQLIWSRGCRPGTHNALQLTYFLLSRNREKIKFGGIQVLWDYHTKGDTSEESTFCVTIGL